MISFNAICKCVFLNISRFEQVCFSIYLVYYFQLLLQYVITLSLNIPVYESIPVLHQSKMSACGKGKRKLSDMETSEVHGLDKKRREKTKEELSADIDAIYVFDNASDGLMSSAVGESSGGFKSSGNLGSSGLEMLHKMAMLPNMNMQCKMEMLPTVNMLPGVKMLPVVNIQSGGSSAFHRVVTKQDTDSLVEALNAIDQFKALTKKNNEIIGQMQQYQVLNLKHNINMFTSTKFLHHAITNALKMEVESLKMANIEVESLEKAKSTYEATIEHKNDMLARKDAEIALIEETCNYQKKISLAISDEFEIVTTTMNKYKDDVIVKEKTIVRMKEKEEKREDHHKHVVCGLNTIVDTYKTLSEKNKKVIKLKDEIIDNIKEKNDVQKKMIIELGGQYVDS